ncbi:MAG TPA: hypothetical protein DCE52_05790 [Rhodobacteraceae bacterium]|nr:hypothetical protein [Paracoccaceae bacterium]
MTTKTNQKINPSNVVIGDEFITILKEDGLKETASKKKRGELITKAMDDGIDFTSKTMSKEQIIEVKNLIALRFPKDAQSILKMGAVKANGAIAADHDGNRFNSQGRPMDWSFWTNKQKRILSDLAKAVVTRKIKQARIKAGGNSTRGLVERLSIECNKLFNAVVKADVDTLPDDFDTLEVIAGFKTVAKNSGFQLVKKSKK